ncbi:MAG: hypothetical protein QF902_11035, partial [Rhodospirillales bacterium]|nr:hypothetical protein [Rhodospirillales bacterium]
YATGYAIMRHAAKAAGIDWWALPGSDAYKRVLGLKTAVRDFVDGHFETNNDRSPTAPQHEAFAAVHILGATDKSGVRLAAANGDVTNDASRGSTGRGDGLSPEQRKLAGAAGDGTDADGNGASDEVQEDDSDAPAKKQAISGFLYGPLPAEAAEDVDEPGGPGAESSDVASERRRTAALSRMDQALNEAFDELKRALDDPARDDARRQFNEMVIDRFLRGSHRNPTFSPVASRVLRDIAEAAFADPSKLEDLRRQFFEERRQVAITGGSLLTAVPAARGATVVGAMIWGAMRAVAGGPSRPRPVLRPAPRLGPRRMPRRPWDSGDEDTGSSDDTADGPREIEREPNAADLKRRVEERARHPGFADITPIDAGKINNEFVGGITSRPDYDPKRGKPHPPHRPDVPAFDVTVSRPEARNYVRFIGKDGEPMARWIMREEDVEGLSLAQIQDKFAIPGEELESIVRVKLPLGTRLRVSATNPHPEWGRGNGVQFEIQGKLDDRWFSKPRKVKR